MYTPSTSEKIWHSSAFKAAASATAVVSEPPLPKVVISKFLLMPWNPATMTTSFFFNKAFSLFVETLKILALLWVSSVSIPACQPVKAFDFIPNSFNAIDKRETLTCSPEDSSIS